MQSFSQIKDKFEALKERKKELRSGIQHFWTSNDHFSLSEILSLEIKEQKSVACDEKDEKHPKKIVNLFVAESDIFSILDKIEGDIIICDIDRVLLQFLELQKELLLKLYEQLIQKNINFEELKNKYTTFLKQYSEYLDDSALDWLNSRLALLEDSHFLFSEQNFVKSMALLKQKQFITLDIDLFNEQENKALCTVLKEEQTAVKLFNLTNLPDYDQNNQLSFLLANLPWHKCPRIIWNIHDRGPFNSNTETDHYTHFPFSAVSVVEYSDHVNERPSFFAEIDKIVLHSFEEEVSSQNLTRYKRSIRIQELPDAKKRLAYETHLGSLSEIKKGIGIADYKTICSKYHSLLPPRNLECIQLLDLLNDRKQTLIKIINQIITLVKFPEIKNLLKQLIKSFQKISSVLIKIDLRSFEIQTRLDDEFERVTDILNKYLDSKHKTEIQETKEIKNALKEDDIRHLFLFQFLITANNLQEIIYQKFNESRHGLAILSFIKSCISSILNMDLTTPATQHQIRQELIQDLKKHNFNFRLNIDEKKAFSNIILSNLLNITIIGEQFNYNKTAEFFQVKNPKEQVNFTPSQLKFL